MLKYNEAVINQLQGLGSMFRMNGLPHRIIKSRLGLYPILAFVTLEHCNDSLET